MKRNLLILLCSFTVLFTTSMNAEEVKNTPLNAVFAPANSEKIEQVETFTFKNTDEQTRAINLSRELRCPQCLNQNLMESNSPIAKDLRLVVYTMVDEGKSDREIIEFMTERFGDFVLYNPAFNKSTYLLWLGPIFMLLLFAMGGAVIVKKNMNNKNK